MINQFHIPFNRLCKECNSHSFECHCKFCNKQLCMRCVKFLYFRFEDNTQMNKLNLNYYITQNKGDESMASTTIVVCHNCLAKILEVYSTFDFQKEVYNLFKSVINSKLNEYIKTKTLI